MCPNPSGPLALCSSLPALPCLPQLVHTLFLISRSHTSAISLKHVAAGGGGDDGGGSGEASVRADGSIE